MGHDDINVLVITHYHSDHMGTLSWFDKAWLVDDAKKWTAEELKVQNSGKFVLNGFNAFL